MNILFNLIKISLLTFLIKIIGFIKDIIISNIFGINMYTDAFYTSIKIQNIFKKILTESTLSYIFIPILSKYKEKKQKKNINEFISSIYFILLISIVGLTIFGLTFSKIIIFFTSSGFLLNKKKFFLTTHLFKMNLPYIILISLSHFIASILNLWNFIYPIICIPLITNINIIIISLLINKYFNISISSLTFSIIISSLIQLLIQRIYIKYIPIKISINKINLKNKGMIQFYKKIIPNILGVSIYQISQIINNNLLSHFKEGSISWIYYADKITELPLSILGITTSNILLAKLSNKYNKKNIKGYNLILDKYLKIIIMLSIPISIFFIIASRLLIITLFDYGKIKYIDILMISKILIINSIGLTGSILTKILIPCFYSQNNITTPNKISIFSLIILQILNIFNIKNFKYLGIAISFCISSYIHSFLLYFNLKRNNMFKHVYKWKNFLIKIIISNTILYIILWLLINKLFIDFIKLNLINRIINIIILFFISIFIYFINLYILNINKDKFL